MRAILYFEALVLVFARLSSAAHNLTLPTALTGNSNEGEPCGEDVSIDSDSPVTNMAVSGLTISIESLSDITDLSIRASLAEDQPYNFVDLWPVIRVTGEGDLCLPQVGVPSEWDGQRIVVQVVGLTYEETTYQCAVVQLVSDPPEVTPDQCSNQTTVDIAFASDSGLSIPDGETPTDVILDTSSPSSPSSTATAPPGSESPSETTAAESTPTSSGLATQPTAAVIAVVAFGLAALGLPVL